MTAVAGVGGTGVENHFATAAAMDKTTHIEVARAEGLQGADAGHAAAFTNAVAQPTTEVRLSAPSDASVIRGDLSRRVEALTSHLATWQADAASSGSGMTAQPGTGDAASGATALTEQMKGAFLFAIETTLLSHGSTESTKIFNTLLKGQ